VHDGVRGPTGKSRVYRAMLKAATFSALLSKETEIRCSKRLSTQALHQSQLGWTLALAWNGGRLVSICRGLCGRDSMRHRNSRFVKTSIATPSLAEKSSCRQPLAPGGSHIIHCSGPHWRRSYGAKPLILPQPWTMYRVFGRTYNTLPSRQVS
jgi:hypothetical protein